MIPKIIHYCWFGGNPKPELIEKCIDSWKKYFVDYEIIEWNESNYDVTKNTFIKEAYEAKKWAYVSDYARLDVMYEYGGIYLDTDVEILDNPPLQEWCEYNSLIPFHGSGRTVATGLIYISRKNDVLCKNMRDYYENMHFSVNSLYKLVNTAVNKPIIDKMFSELIWDGKTQILNGYCFLGLGEYQKYMVHHATMTWADEKEKNIKLRKRKAGKLIQKLRNPLIFKKLSKYGKLEKIYEFIIYDLHDLGLIYYMKRILKKITNKKR